MDIKGQMLKSAGERERCIIEHPKCRFTRYDPRDSGKIGDLIKEAAGLQFASVRIPDQYPSNYLGERVRNYALCAFNPATGEFVL